MNRDNGILILGDLLVLLSFVLIGRSSHSLSLADFAAGLFTALPFVLCWFAVAPWFGLYNTEISSRFRQLLPRLTATWIVAVPIAHIFRALLLGRSILGGIPLTFVLVSLSYIGLVMLLWRGAYAWQRQRQTGDVAS